MMFLFRQHAEGGGQRASGSQQRPPRMTAICLLLSACSSFVSAQTSPEATLDKDQLLIGQQAQLTISVSSDAGARMPAVIWPVVADTITGKIDVVKDGGVDTNTTPQLVTQARTLTITAWDSGYWAIPPFKLVIDGDTAETQALLLGVTTVPVDTAQAIRDIKEIYEVPYRWQDWLRDNWPWVAGGVAALAAIIGGIIWFRRRKPKALAIAVAPEKPLHVRALEALEEVERKKLWQQGLVKEHHSATTDILRGYIEERYQVPALESTTDDLLGILRMSSMNTAQREQLANLLRMADMVKFAKWTPLPTENEQLLAGAIKLVQQTSDALADAPKP